MTYPAIQPTKNDYLEAAINISYASKQRHNLGYAISPTGNRPVLVIKTPVVWTVQEPYIPSKGYTLDGKAVETWSQGWVYKIYNFMLLPLSTATGICIGNGPGLSGKQAISVTDFNKETGASLTGPPQYGIHCGTDIADYYKFQYKRNGNITRWLEPEPVLEAFGLPTPSEMGWTKAREDLFKDLPSYEDDAYYGKSASRLAYFYNNYNNMDPLPPCFGCLTGNNTELAIFSRPRFFANQDYPTLCIRPFQLTCQWNTVAVSKPGYTTQQTLCLTYWSIEKI